MSSRVAAIVISARQKIKAMMKISIQPVFLVSHPLVVIVRVWCILSHLVVLPCPAVVVGPPVRRVGGRGLQGWGHRQSGQIWELEMVWWDNQGGGWLCREGGGWPHKVCHLKEWT